jgi:hypothetical protein
MENHLIGHRSQPFNLLRPEQALFDFKGLAGVHIPHPPTAPSRIPKDAEWWMRNLGGANRKPQITGMQYLPDAYKMAMRLLNGHG